MVFGVLSNHLGRNRIIANNTFKIVRFCVSNYSGKNENAKNTFKQMLTRRPSNDNKLATVDPNVELFITSNGYPFILPGDVGIGWFNMDTTLKCPIKFTMKLEKNAKPLNASIICQIQSCPTVLQKDVINLFPYRPVQQQSELSVVTIYLNGNSQLLKSHLESETERLAQIFLLTARKICEKLRNAGYWSDFINPFSGRPYLIQSENIPLYTVDKKFRCLDFQISEVENCKIVSSHQKLSNKFIGNLFTTAPAMENTFNKILTSI